MLDAKVGISPSRARKLQDAPLCQSWAKDGTPRITRDLPRGVEETRVLTIGAMRARGPSRATSGLRGPYRTRGQLGGDDPNVRRRHGPSALLPTVSRSGSGARHGMGGTQVRERPDLGARCSRPRPGGGAWGRGLPSGLPCFAGLGGSPVSRPSASVRLGHWK